MHEYSTAGDIIKVDKQFESFNFFIYRIIEKLSASIQVTGFLV